MQSQEGWGLFSSSMLHEEQPREEVMWPRPSAARVKSVRLSPERWPSALPPAGARTFHAGAASSLLLHYACKWKRKEA